MACILFSGTCLWYWHVLQIQTKILQSLACCNDSFILHICCNMQASSCRCAWYVVCSLSTWHSKIRKLWLTALAARHHTCRHGCRLAESRLATVTSCFYTSTSLNIQTFHSDSACGSRESLMVQPGLPKSLTQKNVVVLSRRAPSDSVMLAVYINIICRLSNGCTISSFLQWTYLLTEIHCNVKATVQGLYVASFQPINTPYAHL